MLSSIDIKSLKGVGEKRAESLYALGVNDIDALFHFYPRTYEDWSNPVSISDAPIDTKCCIKATVTTSVTRWKAKSNIMMYKATVCDSTGAIQIVIFNNRFSAAKLKMGEEFLFFGAVSMNGRQKQMLSPSIERVVGKQKIRPIYRRTGTLSSNYIESLMSSALAIYGGRIKDPLPEEIKKQYKLANLEDAIFDIHFPRTAAALQKARDRLIFDEFLNLRLGFALMRSENRKTTNMIIKTDFTEEFYKKLPFEPTSAQRKCVKAAVADMQSGFSMNRLLQGDVGSGKTMVAAALCYNMWKNGYQSAIMAPTEILANQHYETMKSFFEGTGAVVVILTGGMSPTEKRKVLTEIEDGSADIVIGTHSLIYDNVNFKELGFVVTDEQHRFGVRQRVKLASKACGAHVLVMSATPIPRTLALSIYGDLDVSVIDELPKGRIPVETYKIDSFIRMRAFNYIKKFLDEGRQGYIVCPLVEEGESDNLLSATDYFDRISKNEFKDYKVGLLHGKMKPQEKEFVMDEFVHGRIQLLVTTVVIEVGVDVPNAVIMLIENAERFGLSQLHQLRGRVGRGKYKSTCILLSDNDNEITEKRLKTMCATNDGFEIAKTDLKIRGPGEFFGSMQHGLPNLKIADMSDDVDVLTLANEAADNLLKRDPDLSSEENTLLRENACKLFMNVASSC